MSPTVALTLFYASVGFVSGCGLAQFGIPGYDSIGGVAGALLVWRRSYGSGLSIYIPYALAAGMGALFVRTVGDQPAIGADGSRHMDHNPYSPPTAPVADIPIDQTAKNYAVWTACKLYWASFGISLISLVLDIIGAPVAGSMVSGIVGALLGGAIGLLITRWIVSKLKARRNWMRLLLTICTALGVISIVIFWDFYRRNVFPIYANDPINAVQAVLQAILGFCAVVLLNTTSARAWFHRGINPPLV